MNYLTAYIKSDIAVMASIRLVSAFLVDVRVDVRDDLAKDKMGRSSTKNKSKLSCNLQVFPHSLNFVHMWLIISSKVIPKKIPKIK